MSRDEYVALRKGWALGYLFRALELGADAPRRGYFLRYANQSVEEACLATDEDDPELDWLDETVQLATDGYL
jgi:hypothetical protein